MIKYVNYDIVCQEFPYEITLAINCSLCPNSCPGCHSPQLAGDIGEELTLPRLYGLVSDLQGAITCVALMGGDNDPKQVERLLKEIKDLTHLRTGWYSGKAELPEGIDLSAFNYIKLGPYQAECGPLNKETTNQRFYKVEGNRIFDMTSLFWKK